MNRSFQPRSRRGALTVEVALCIPLVLSIFFACYEIARANMILHVTEAAAYEGARIGIVPGATPDRIRASASQTLRSVGISDFQISIVPETLDEDTNEVEVQVTVPLRKNMAIPGIFFDDPTFRGACRLTRESTN